MRLVKFRGRWCVAQHEAGKGTQRRSLGLPATASRQEAEREFADYKLRAAKDATTVGEIIANYLADKLGRATAHQRLEDAWKALKPEAGHFRPDQITRQWSRDYRAKRLAAGRQDGTIRRELATLRAGLRWANKNTPAVVELPPAPPPKERVLTKAEVDRLVDAADRFHIKLAIRLLYATAARKEAILDLTWDRVNLDTGLVQLALDDGKRRKGRAAIRLSTNTLTLLRGAKDAATTEYVVEWAGQPVKSIRTGFAAAVALVQAGKPMQEVAQYLGHKETRTTERVYARFSPDYLKGLADVLD